MKEGVTSSLDLYLQNFSLSEGLLGLSIEVFLVVLAVVVINFALKKVLLRFEQRALKTKIPWDDALIKALMRPLNAFVWIVGITYAAQIIHDKTDTAIFAAAEGIRDMGIILVLSWFLLRFARNFENTLIETKLSKGEITDRATIEAIGKLIRISIFITAGLMALHTVGINIAGVLAFGGIGGIVIGFAAKDLLSNFFGGLMIYLDRPFVVGDWIRSDDKEIEGTVEEIGWRLTRIRKFDKRPIYVPNATFMSIAVENPSRMTNRRIYETVGIRYDDIGKMEAIVHDVKEMLKSHPEIDQNQTMIVNFNSFAASSIDFFVYTFTKTTGWVHFHGIKQDVLLKIAKIINDHSAEMAFPTSTMYLPDGLKLYSDLQHAAIPADSN